jgi:hypothetical protein
MVAPKDTSCIPKLGKMGIRYENTTRSIIPVQKTGAENPASEIRVTKWLK